MSGTTRERTRGPPRRERAPDIDLRIFAEGKRGAAEFQRIHAIEIGLDASDSAVVSLALRCEQVSRCDEPDKA
jgi:hypothetical protein